MRYSIKDDRWHILNRTGMYMGSTVEAIFTEYVFTDKLEQIELTYTPALVKMINEIIDNSVDVLQNSNNGFIKVNLTKDTVQIIDNGNGIPIKKITDLNNKSVLIPFSCWGLSKAGSNFNEDSSDETTIGTNGVGSYCTNVLSTKFIGNTSDGKFNYIGTWTNNAEEYTEILSNSKKKGTIVEFYPDFSRLDCEEISKDVFKVIKQRLINLSLIYKNIKFYFNKELIKINIASLVGDNATTYIEDKFSLSIEPNLTDDFKCFTIINGLNMKGGNHIDYILNYIIQSIREKLPKKYSSIKPGDIKNKLQLIFVGKDFPRLKFESQTKETLKNSTKEITDYLGENWKSVIKEIIKNKNIIKNITEYYDMKEDYEAKKALKELNKPVKKIRIDKYKPAINEQKYLICSEGISASSSVEAATGRDNIGFYPLKGKILNCLKAKISKIKNSQEVKDLVDILGMDLINENELNYENIVIATDADLDGCLRADTKIKLLNGQSKTIKELSELYPIGGDNFEVWSYDTNKNIPVPGIAHSVRATKKVKEIYKITFDNDSVIYATDNHPFLTIDGIYKRSDELKVNDSIESTYFNKNSDGYETIKHRTFKNTTTHRYIGKLLYENIKEHDIHHKNFNKLDNTTCNLQKLTRAEHSHLHNIIDSNFKKYNGSEKHLQDIRKATERGAYKDTHFKEWNYSKKHSQVVSERNKRMWKDEKYRKHMKSKQQEYFNNGGKEKAKENTTNQWKDDDIAFTMQATRMVNVIKKCYAEYGKITEDLYNLTKPRTGVPKWENMLRKLNINESEVLEYANTYNHKIKNIEIIQTDEIVYDMTVDKYNNFGVEIKDNELVYVHNSHITSLILTLFVKYRPDLIQKGFIKYLKTPVVVGYKKDTPVEFIFSLEEYYKEKENKKGIEWKYKKGLSSMDELEWGILFKDGIEPYLETLEWSEDLYEVFDIWMGDEAQKRKEALLDLEFDINMV